MRWFNGSNVVFFCYVNIEFGFVVFGVWVWGYVDWLVWVFLLLM